MAGITFNLILIRVYKDRLRLTARNADTGDTNRHKSPWGLRFSAAHSTTTPMTPESQAAHQVNEVHHDRADKGGDVRGY